MMKVREISAEDEAKIMDAPEDMRAELYVRMFRGESLGEAVLKMFGFREEPLEDETK